MGREDFGMMTENGVQGLANWGVPVDLVNARVHGYYGLQRILVNREGIVYQIVSMHTVSERLPSADLQVWDMTGDWISLGGVDLQINGGLGLAFPDVTEADDDRLQAICDYLWKEGVDGFLPTLVTTAVENIQRSLTVFSQFRPRSGARILGVHLEGPFLNPEKRGAHPAEHLLPLTIPQIKHILGDYADLVKVITLAPELDETGDTLSYLKALGITVSLGHSQATEAQARSAFAKGASMVTHAFNAMPPLHHRQPGLLGAALTQTQVACGFIADGEHVAPTVLKILLRSSPHLFLVSDALSPLGLPDGIYPWDSRQIEVIQGTARLVDGTLSGTTRSLLTGVQNLVNWGVTEPEVAIALATVAPREAIGLSTSLLGRPAHLLRWSSTAAGLNWQRL
jgi:N-acetylglucosamine-6-phosphate deacetylase